MKKLWFEMVTQWCRISPERLRDIEQLFWDGRGRTALGGLLKYKITYIFYQLSASARVLTSFKKMKI